jgi:hypothetical protein
LSTFEKRPSADTNTGSENGKKQTGVSRRAPAPVVVELDDEVLELGEHNLQHAAAGVDVLVVKRRLGRRR